MSDVPSTQTGGCLCGAARYHLTAAPAQMGACHCSFCRKISGGVQLGIQVAADGLVWDQEDSVTTYASSPWAERGFCKICGSNLFWRLTAPGPGQGSYALAAGTLDSQEGLTLTEEIYIDHKPAGYAFAGDLKQMTEADVMAMVSGEAPS